MLKCLIAQPLQSTTPNLCQVNQIKSSIAEVRTVFLSISMELNSYLLLQNEDPVIIPVIAKENKNSANKKISRSYRESCRERKH